MAAVLDAISPLERVKLSAQLATSLGSLNASPGPLERVRLSGQVAELLRKLGADSRPPVAPAAAGSEFPLAEAASSYSGISHRGTSNAKADRDTYEGAVARELEAARPLAETEQQQAVLVSEEAAFRSEYLSQYRSLMQVRAATYSSHIAGRSGFNSKQASARNSALDKANDRFYTWFEAQKGRIKAAVLRARSPEQLAAEQAIKDEKQAEKDRKSVEFMVKVLSFKRGDDLRLGNSIVTKVSKDKDGYPAKLTFTFTDGTKPFDDKIDLLRVLYRGDKEALRRDADAAIALLNPPEPGTDPAPALTAKGNPIIDEAVLLDVGLLYTWGDQWKYKYSAEAAGFFTAPNKAEAIERASDTYANAAPGTILTRAERDAKADAEELAQMQRQYGRMTLQELRDKFESMGGDITSLRAAGKNELSGDGRRTAAAVANQGARDVAGERMRLGRYIAKREAEEASQPTPTPADGKSRAVAGGQDGINGYAYKGGQFLPNTMAEPGRWKLNGKWVTGGKELIAPGEYEFAPTPFSRAIYMAAGLSSYCVDAGGGQLRLREGLYYNDGSPITLDSEVRPGVRGVLSKTAFTLGEMLNAYNQGLRWVEVEPDAETITTQDAAELAKAIAKFKAIAARAPQPEPDADNETASAPEIVEHVTKGGKGKTIRGIVRTDLSYAEAKAIDEYTFKKNGGWFIREKHLEGFTPAPSPGRPDPAPKVELTPEQIAQAEADRIADAQLKEAQRLREVASKLRAAGESTVGKADEELGRDRLTNTARRASMAGSIIERHEASRAIGLTMQNLAQAIESGQAVHLNGVTSRVQVELLLSLLRGGKFEAERGLTYTEQLAQRGRPFDAKDVAYTKFPTATAFRDHFKWAAEKLEKKAPAGNSRLITALRKLGAHPLERFPMDDQKAEVARQGYKALQAIRDGHYLSTEIEAINRLDRLRRMGITNTMQLQDALREFLEYREGARAEDPIKKAERAIIGQKVGLDFFPTPMATATRMAALARIKKGDRVLEPSAGNGNLADAAKAAGGEVDVVEMSSQLRDILQAKGYSIVGHDFETFEPEEKYDAVIMNPPFSDRRDSAHIQRAFGMLKAGGHLVAIAGEGVFFGSDAKAKQFQQWLEQVGAEVESLDQGTFKDKSLLATTGANARLIVIQK